MGGRPVSALALAVVRHARPRLVEEELYQMLSGAVQAGTRAPAAWQAVHACVRAGMHVCVHARACVHMHVHTYSVCMLSC